MAVEQLDGDKTGRDLFVGRDTDERERHEARADRRRRLASQPECRVNSLQDVSSDCKLAFQLTDT